jgi:hypothetical protein
MHTQAQKLNNSKGVRGIVRGSNTPVKTKQQRQHRFTLQQKVSIVDEWEALRSIVGRGSLKQITEKYDINSKLLYNWQKTKKALIDYLEKQQVEDKRHLFDTKNAKSKSLNPGRSVRYPNVESWLYENFEEYREKHWPVTTRLLSVIALSRFPLLFHSGDPAGRYKRVFDWIYRFRERYQISVRRKTHNAIQDEQNMGF